MLREEFGRKVKRSEYTRSATAIGLAIQAGEASGYTLREVFTRNFGVWRESDAGQRMIFDPIFPRGTRLPAADEPPLTVCAPLSAGAQYRRLPLPRSRRASTTTANPPATSPCGTKFCSPSIPLWRTCTRWPASPVEKSAAAATQEIEEQYACDATGVVTVTIRNTVSHYGREFKLGRWSGKSRGGAAVCSQKRARKAST